MGGGQASSGLMGAGTGGLSGALTGFLLGGPPGAAIGAALGGTAGGLGGVSQASNQTSPIAPPRQPGPAPNFGVFNQAASNFGASPTPPMQGMPTPAGGGMPNQTQAAAAPPSPTSSGPLPLQLQSTPGSLPQALSQKPAGQNQANDPAIQQAQVAAFFQRLQQLMGQGQAGQVQAQMAGIQ